ncbi:MAG: circularly permuted type 2 ATP-grasp protein, partial [Planctomycetaceae bacterium]
MALAHYQQRGFYDETFEDSGAPRPGCEALVGRLQTLTDDELDRYQKAADAAMLQMGITFQVYGDSRASERIFPFDILPRLIRLDEWRHIENGLRQRIRALNSFLDDVYNDQRIIAAGKVPAALIETATCVREQCRGLKPPKGVWCHITGTDLVRDKDGTIYV